MKPQPDICPVRGGPTNDIDPVDLGVIEDLVAFCYAWSNLHGIAAGMAAAEGGHKARWWDVS